MLKYHLAFSGAPRVGYTFYHFIINELSLKKLTLENLFCDIRLLSQICNKPQTMPESLKVPGPKHIQQIETYLSNFNWDDLEATFKWLDSAENQIITIDDSKYPNLLKSIYAPPPILYAKGNVDLLSSVQFAIVGSRNPTKSGEQTAYDFASYLSQAGMVITSGMALGVDAASHQACIDHQQATIAVIGTGIDRIYPARHKELAHQIANTGLIISEFPLGTAPNKSNFPRRNQLISGLSVGTLVVEAALKSGSLITAQSALEQGREVFAIPGSIHNPLARGCHHLIKQGAKLVESAQDIVEEISPLLISAASLNLNPQDGIESQLQNNNNNNNSKNKNKETSNESVQEKQGILAFIDYEPISLDELSERSQLDISEVNVQISLLELEGKINHYPDGRVSL